MRFYSTFPVAINEITRELKEMGILLHPKSVQNLDVSTNPDYDMFELQDYSYRVTQPQWQDIPLRSQEWFNAEFAERVSGIPLNPGEAWKFRADYWKQFFSTKPGRQGIFDYAYPDRMSKNLLNVIEALKADPYTRRAWLSVLSNEDPPSDFECRFPCSVGYHFMFRQDQLNMTYYLRSSDFFEHFNFDIALADRLKCYVADKVGMKPGCFTHVIGSLHCFTKDVKSVF
jgi:hypothetical protein